MRDGEKEEEFHLLTSPRQKAEGVDADFVQNKEQQNVNLIRKNTYKCSLKACLGRVAIWAILWRLFRCDQPMFDMAFLNLIDCCAGF